MNSCGTSGYFAISNLWWIISFFSGEKAVYIFHGRQKYKPWGGFKCILEPNQEHPGDDVDCRWSGECSKSRRTADNRFQSERGFRNRGIRGAETAHRQTESQGVQGRWFSITSNGIRWGDTGFCLGCRVNVIPPSCVPSGLINVGDGMALWWERCPPCKWRQYVSR